MGSARGAQWVSVDVEYAVFWFWCCFDVCCHSSLNIPFLPLHRREWNGVLKVGDPKEGHLGRGGWTGRLVHASSSFLVDIILASVSHTRVQVEVTEWHKVGMINVYTGVSTYCLGAIPKEIHDTNKPCTIMDDVWAWVSSLYKVSYQHKKCVNNSLRHKERPIFSTPDEAGPSLAMLHLNLLCPNYQLLLLWSILDYAEVGPTMLWPQCLQFNPQKFYKKGKKTSIVLSVYQTFKTPCGASMCFMN